MSGRLTRIVLLLALVAGADAVAQDSSQEKAAEAMNALDLGQDAQIKGFRVPNYDEQSVMTSQIFGEFARVLPDGNVEITQLRIEFYEYVGEERLVNMTVTSPLCYFNRENGVAISDSDVRISRNDLVVTGKGFVFHNGNQQLKILSESKVVLKGASKDKGFGGLAK